MITGNAWKHVFTCYTHMCLTSFWPDTSKLFTAWLFNVSTETLVKDDICQENWRFAFSGKRHKPQHLDNFYALRLGFKGGAGGIAGNTTKWVKTRKEDG